MYQLLHRLTSSHVMMLCGVQLRAATDFLSRVHPIRHQVPVRKSQVHHALCEMLASILQPLVEADAPRSVSFWLLIAIPPRSLGPPSNFRVQLCLKSFILQTCKSLSFFASEVQMPSYCRGYWTSGTASIGYLTLGTESGMSGHCLIVPATLFTIHAVTFPWMLGQARLPSGITAGHA